MYYRKFNQNSLFGTAFYKLRLIDFDPNDDSFGTVLINTDLGLFKIQAASISGSHKFITFYVEHNSEILKIECLDYIFEDGETSNSIIVTDEIISILIANISLLLMGITEVDFGSTLKWRTPCPSKPFKKFAIKVDGVSYQYLPSTNEIVIPNELMEVIEFPILKVNVSFLDRDFIKGLNATFDCPEAILYMITDDGIRDMKMAYADFIQKELFMEYYKRLEFINRQVVLQNSFKASFVKKPISEINEIASELHHGASKCYHSDTINHCIDMFYLFGLSTLSNQPYDIECYSSESANNSNGDEYKNCTSFVLTSPKLTYGISFPKYNTQLNSNVPNRFQSIRISDTSFAGAGTKVINISPKAERDENYFKFFLNNLLMYYFFKFKCQKLLFLKDLPSRRSEAILENSTNRTDIIHEYDLNPDIDIKLSINLSIDNNNGSSETSFIISVDNSSAYLKRFSFKSNYKADSTSILKNINAGLELLNFDPFVEIQRVISDQISVLTSARENISPKADEFLEGFW